MSSVMYWVFVTHFVGFLKILAKKLRECCMKIKYHITLPLCKIKSVNLTILIQEKPLETRALKC